MQETLKVTPLDSKIDKPKEPEDVRIVLSVCGCYRHEKLVFLVKKASLVAQLLGVTIEKLESTAIVAMITGRPQLVACYRQRDIGETKLRQLQVETPFILKTCHWFTLSES